MSELNGVFISLKTGSRWWSGTDDHLYLGVVGTVGGREFALGVDDFDDFEPGTTVTYSIGPGAEFFGGREPATAPEALETMLICLPNVTHVYLRKQGDRTYDEDDAWQLENAYIYLVAPGEPTRVFQTTGRATLGNEHGLQVWLAEVFHGGAYRDARIPGEDSAECEPQG